MRIWQVDAFASQAFTGNPAAVCILEEPAPVEWMQSLAGEMNLSETVFLQRISSADPSYHIRWFTPLAEVALCGHATLAGAHVLYEQGFVSREEKLEFLSQSGPLRAQLEGDTIFLDFPALIPEVISPPADLEMALGVQSVCVAKSRFDLLVELADEAAVRACRPTMALLEQLDYRAVIITSAGSGDFDFISRFFAPRVGVPEDPVTGSAHCCLVPYWGQRLGKTELRAYQASRRGGELRLRWQGDRVALGGPAVTVLTGELTPRATRGCRAGRVE